MDNDNHALAKAMLELYNMDISRAKCIYSPYCRSFLFSDEKKFVRISRVLLGQSACFSPLTAAPIKTVTFDMNTAKYDAAEYYSPRAGVLSLDSGKEYFLAAGTLLGRIHALGAQLSQRMAAPPMTEFVKLRSDLLSANRNYLNVHAPEIFASEPGVFLRIDELTGDKGEYGIVHGDFVPANIFADGLNAYACDFSHAHRGYYLMDIAAFAFELLCHGFEPDKSCRDVLYTYFPAFLQGYELIRPIDKASLSMLPDFIYEYAFMQALRLINGGRGIEPNGTVTLSALLKLLSEQSLISALDAMRQELKPKPVSVTYGVQPPSVIVLEGSLGTYNVDTFEKQIMAAVLSGVKCVELNCDKLTYISSSGLRMLLRVKKQGINVMLTNVSSEVRKILDMTGFNQLLALL